MVVKLSVPGDYVFTRWCVTLLLQHLVHCYSHHNDRDNRNLYAAGGAKLLPSLPCCHHVYIGFVHMILAVHRLKQMIPVSLQLCSQSSYLALESREALVEIAELVVCHAAAASSALS